MTKREPKSPFDAKAYAKHTGFDGKWRDSWWREDFLHLLVKRFGAVGPTCRMPVRRTRRRQVPSCPPASAAGRM